MRIYTTIYLLLACIVPLVTVAQQIPAEQKNRPADEILYLEWPAGWEMTQHLPKAQRVDLMFHPPKQDASAWLEMGMVSVLKGKGKNNLLEFVYDNNSSLKNSCATHEFNILMDSSTAKKPFIIYQFYLGRCTQSDSLAPARTWINVVKPGKEHLFLAQYGIKGERLTATQQQLWVSRLRKAYLQPLPAGVRNFAF